MIAPYAASLAPMTRPHQKAALSLQMVVLDSFQRGAMLIACNGGASSVEGVGLASCEAGQCGSLALAVMVAVAIIQIALLYLEMAIGGRGGGRVHC